MKRLQFTALVLIACIGLADASLYLRYAQTAVDDSYIVTEEHELETALADGNYSGNGSDSENGDEGSVEIAEGKRLFNILEIYPTEKKGIVGYTIGGCEPFNVDEVKEGNRVTVTKQQMKMAVMDALVNPNPGSSNGNDQNIVNNNTLAKYLKDINEKIKEGGSTYPFTFEHSKTYNGYYKYVGGNKGFYCIDNKKTASQKVTSRFYDTSSPKRTDFDYIFIYDEATSDSKDVPVTGEKRIRYINNEKFIKDWMGKSGAAAQAEKQKYEFEVTTRTPRSVTIEDIERADLILVNDAYKNDYFKFALELQNKLYGQPTDKDNGLHFYSPENDGNIKRGNRLDFDDFEKVIRIYERVVLREDVAFVAEKTCCTGYYGGEIQKINTNMRKLMFMLFYVQSGSVKQKGRDVFTDFFKRYTSQPGEIFAYGKNGAPNVTYYDMRKLHLSDPTHYPVDYRAASLKRNTDDPTRSDYYYMHAHADYHVGHPLVLNQNTAITGVQLENVTAANGNTVTLPKLDDSGYIVPLHDTSKTYRLTIERIDDYQFKDAGIEFQQWSQDPGKYYKSGNNYYYKYCYESMSNTTDYIYIDNDGRLVIDTKYSSDQAYNTNYQNYWFRIDADYSVNGYAFRRRKWGPQTWNIYDNKVDDAWPWDSSGDGKPLTEWLMHRKTEGNNYDCNLHMWYDYYDFRSNDEKYTTVKQPPFGQTYKNQSLMEENGFFKGNWIKNALSGREIKREETDINHIVNRAQKNYYISMNILNGDGVNKSNEANPATKNKVLYYNQYEKDDITAYEAANPSKSKIPINIRIRTSCKLVGVKVYNGAGGVISSYEINSDVSNANITKTGSGGKSLTLTAKNTLDATGFPELRTAEPDRTPIYTYEGSIYDITWNKYSGKRNAKFTVEFTALLPDGTTTKTISDEITVVRRDFFMLD